MTDRLTGVTVFVEAVEAGSFSAAGVRLNLSRSSIGKAIARLEVRLGVRLFHRTTRSQALTDDGQAFYEHCLRALDEIGRGEAMLDRGRHEAAGRLRVTMPVLFGRHCVAPILTELARQHPRLDLELSFSDRLADLVEDGFDLAVRNGPLANVAGVIARRISSQRMTLCAAPAYLQARGIPVSIDALHEHDLVAYGRTGVARPWLLFDGGNTPVPFVPQSRFRFDDLEAIADATAAGLGVAWLPCWLIAEHVRLGRLTPLFADQTGLVMESYALWPETPSLPLRLRIAIDALAAELPRRMT
jgi:DNA-binding transcriptional LysR family regulator